MNDLIWVIVDVNWTLPLYIGSSDPNNETSDGEDNEA